jgi:hypothetical protein
MLSGFQDLNIIAHPNLSFSQWSYHHTQARTFAAFVNHSVLPQRCRWLIAICFACVWIDIWEIAPRGTARNVHINGCMSCVRSSGRRKPDTGPIILVEGRRAGEIDVRTKAESVKKGNLHVHWLWFPGKLRSYIVNGGKIQEVYWVLVLLAVSIGG